MMLEKQDKVWAGNKSQVLDECNCDEETRESNGQMYHCDCAYCDKTICGFCGGLRE